MPLAEDLINSQAAEALIRWEVHVTTAVEEAVEQAVAEFGPTVEAIQSAYDAVVDVIGEAVAAAYRVGYAIAAAAARITGAPQPPPGRRPRRPRRPGQPRRPVRGGRRPSPPPAVPDTQGRVREVTTRAVTEIREGADPQETMRRTTTALSSTGTTAVNESAAQGSLAYARQVGAAGLVWVAERDACVHCLSLAGQTTTSGEFDPDATLADGPLRWRHFTGLPPRHPHCRCRTIAWMGEDDDVPTALTREAQRSIIRGWSLPSESGPARLRAAERLLRQGTVLPRSVERYGRQAVRAGEFPRGRTPPTTQRDAA